MVTVDKAIIAKLTKGGKHFEVLVDPDLAYDLRSGKQISVQKMVAVNMVFHDAKKGDKAGPHDLQKSFGTEDAMKISEAIVKEGDIQLTTEFRRKKTEEKRKQVAGLIARQAVDPRTKAPHTQDRILNAMEQAHVNIDPFRAAEHQAGDVIKAIKGILPLSIEEIELQVSVDAKYSGRVYQIAKEYGSYTENWTGQTLTLKIKIPAGLKERFYSALAGATEGTVRVQEMGQ